MHHHLRYISHVRTIMYESDISSMVIRTVKLKRKPQGLLVQHQHLLSQAIKNHRLEVVLSI